MSPVSAASITNAYFSFILDKSFPCIAAKAALADEEVRVLVCEHMACPKDDYEIVQFLHNFVDAYRCASKSYTSAVVIFKGPTTCSEEHFDTLLWQRLQSVSDLDAEAHRWDKRVGNDPELPDFSFSIKEEAFYIIGLHPGSSRKARQFEYPALVFNPHAQFERLRETTKYKSMQDAVRKRDILLSGSVNPMLVDFGEGSEAIQYSGRQYDNSWQCPFISHHENNENHPSP